MVLASPTSLERNLFALASFKTVSLSKLNPMRVQPSGKLALLSVLEALLIRISMTFLKVAYF